MNTPAWLTGPRAAGALFVFAFVVLFGGIGLFLTRGGARTATTARLVWERGFIMAAVLLTAFGLLLLAKALATSPGAVPARLGAAIYCVAAVILVTAEALQLSQGTPRYPLIVVYVVLAFLAQAALGAALLLSPLLPPWAGWIAIAWNLAWLVALPLTTPRDIYFPILHHIVPLLLGVQLLGKA